MGQSDDGSGANATDGVATDPEAAGPGLSDPETRSDGGADGDGPASTYRGLLGAFPYAARATDSLLCKTYVAVGALLALVVLAFFLIGVVSAFKNTLGAVGGTFTFSRTFVFLVGTVVGVPVVAPILMVARRHRLGSGSIAYDRGLALTGYVYALSLYLALVISAPPGQREAPPAAIAPVVDALYALPPAAGVVPPLGTVLLMYAVHRVYRGAAAES